MPVGLDCFRPHLNPQVRWKTRKRNVGEPVVFGRPPGNFTPVAQEPRREEGKRFKAPIDPTGSLRLATKPVE
jgi:hypothetical protein